MMSEDNGLDVLLDLLRDGSYAVPEALVAECYAVERQYQYDRDRDVPLNHLRRLVEAEASHQLEAEGTQRTTYETH
jgi:hypothetical protein